MNAFMAFLHQVAAFALVAALVVEFVVIRDVSSSLAWWLSCSPPR
jgi:uncharacterized membrane protein